MRKPTRGSGDRGRGRWERMIKEIIIHIVGGAGDVRCRQSADVPQGGGRCHLATARGVAGQCGA